VAVARRSGSSSSKNASAAAAPANNWAEKSNQLREAMRAARAYAKAEENGDALPPPMPSRPDPTAVVCPSCGRSFSATAAERHIPKCDTIKAKV
jgi:rubrerythrin